MGDALWLLRMFDKARAAANGTIYDYIYPCPMDKGVMQRWGVKPKEFDQAIAVHKTDEAIYDWLRSRASSQGIDAANQWLLNEKRENLDRQDAEEGAGIKT